MHIHIVGICGTFMAGVALLAREAGHRVSGSDAGAYPPMSTQLEAAGIRVMRGYEAEHLETNPDFVVVGNVATRGMPIVEAVLDRGVEYISGPQWLSEQILRGRWVLVVAGTHGKTTTSAMLAWILEQAGLAPGFLIGGLPENFGCSARLGLGSFFVVEGDEYDTAFFDKRSKFVHYRPRTLILNNLEFDHADIFADLHAIETQFHHLLRTVPGTGRIMVNADDANLARVLMRGCWSSQERFGAQGWQARLTVDDGSRFEVYFEDRFQGQVAWNLTGQHNVYNALAALGAARHAGVPSGVATDALCSFRGVRRRMELRGVVDGIAVYDDFAHHPTAIASTLKGLRAKVGEQRILAVLEPRSNTMRMGVHRQTLVPALAEADKVYLYRPRELEWDPSETCGGHHQSLSICASVQEIVDAVSAEATSGDSVLIMSNGGFEGIHQRMLEALSA